MALPNYEGIGTPGGANREFQSIGSVNIFFWFCILIHITDAFWLHFRRGSGLGIIAFALYTIVFFWAIYLFAFGKGADGRMDWRAFGTCLALSLLSYLIPYFAIYMMSVFDIFASMPLLWVEGVIFFAPIWIIYLFIISPSELIRRFATIYYIFWIGIFTLALIKNYTSVASALAAVGFDAPEVMLRELPLNPFEPISAVILGTWDNGKLAWQNFKEGFNKTSSRFWQTYDQTLSPDYYAGTVDANAKEKLGVFIGSIQKASTTFYSDEQIDLWATVEVRALLDETVEADMSCYAKKGDEKIPASKIYPSQANNLILVQDIDCQFDKGVLKSGTYSVSLTADFDFKTMAYQKMYFIERERYLSLRRSDIDPLDQFGITDKTPQAVNTKGPVIIGMDTRNPLKDLSLDNQDNIPLVLGITIDNQWDGKLNLINELTVILPKGMKLKDNTCAGYSFLPSSCTDIPGCEDELSEVYKLKDKIDLRQEEMYRTFRCPVEITDPASLLGNNPISTQYFKVIADYNYILEGKTSLSVKKGLTDEDLTEEQAVQLCIGKSKGDTCAVNMVCSEDDGRCVDKCGYENSDWGCSCSKVECDDLIGRADPKCTTSIDCSNNNYCCDSDYLTIPLSAGLDEDTDIYCNDREDGEQCLDTSGNSMPRSKCKDGKCIDECDYQKEGFLSNSWGCGCTVTQCSRLEDLSPSQCERGLCMDTASYCCNMDRVDDSCEGKPEGEICGGFLKCLKGECVNICDYIKGSDDVPSGWSRCIPEECNEDKIGQQCCKKPSGTIMQYYCNDLLT